MAAKAGPRGNLQDTEPLSLTLPITLYRYIEWLARNSMLGPTMQDVVVKILSKECHAMFDGGFHNKRHPETTSPAITPEGEEGS